MSAPTITRICLASLAFFLLAGCSFVEPERSGMLLQTDQAAYETRLETDSSYYAEGREYISVEIPYETHNTTGAPLYLIGCIRAPQAGLEKRVGDEWVHAYGEIIPYCLSPPWVIAPGEVRRDTLRVRGYLPGQNIAPTFETPVEGTYRLNRQIFAALTDEEAPLGRHQLPTSRSVSNTFELR